MAYFIEDREAEHIKNLLDYGDAKTKKRALQRLCSLLRSGQIIASPQLRHALEQTFRGIVVSGEEDLKVIKWALNAIAEIGHKESVKAVEICIKDYGHDPDIAASAVAAYFRLATIGLNDLHEKYDIQPELIKLASLRSVPFSKVDLGDTQIDVENSSPDLLRMALIVVGIGNAPANLFHPRFENRELVRALGTHHDRFVAQYSVWAVAENDNLDVSDVGVPISDIENQPPNVREWLYRLVAANPDKVRQSIEVIRLGTGDEAAEAREGLAIGLRDTFFEGLDSIVWDWFGREDDRDVLRNLTEHMARNCLRADVYWEYISKTIMNEGGSSEFAQRMYAATAGTPVYGKLKRLEAQGGEELFPVMAEGDKKGSGNTYVNIGNVSGSNFSVHGNVEQHGDIDQSQGANAEEIQKIIQEF